MLTGKGLNWGIYGQDTSYISLNDYCDDHYYCYLLKFATMANVAFFTL